MKLYSHLIKSLVCRRFLFLVVFLFSVSAFLLTTNYSLLAIPTAHAIAFPMWEKIENPTTGNDSALVSVIDGNYIFVGGYQNNGNDSQWRIEKRRIDNGRLCDVANCGDDAFNTNGVIIVDSANQGWVTGLITDSANLYAIGIDEFDGAQSKIYIRKYNKTTGSIISQFILPKPIELNTVTTGWNNNSPFYTWTNKSINRLVRYFIEPNIVYAKDNTIVSVTVLGSGTGYVTSNPSGINCGDGGRTACSKNNFTTSVTLTAISTQGSVFGSWTGCNSSSGNTCTIINKQVVQVKAYFNIPTSDGYYSDPKIATDGTYMYITFDQTDQNRWVFAKMRLSDLILQDLGGGKVYRASSNIYNAPNAILLEGSSLYTIGVKDDLDTVWYIEKRDNNFTLGTGFDGDGKLEISGNFGFANTITFSGNYIYIGGMRGIADFDYRGIIEKIDNGSGIRVTTGGWPLTFGDNITLTTEGLVVDNNDLYVGSFYIYDGGSDFNVRKWNISSTPSLVWQRSVSSTHYYNWLHFLKIFPENDRDQKSIIFGGKSPNDTNDMWRVDKLSQEVVAGDLIRAGHVNALAQEAQRLIIQGGYSIPSALSSLINNPVQAGNVISQSPIPTITTSLNTVFGINCFSGASAGDVISKTTFNNISNTMNANISACMLVNLQHTKQDCTNAGGQVSDIGDVYVCQFTANMSVDPWKTLKSGKDNILKDDDGYVTYSFNYPYISGVSDFTCPSGWNPYRNWSADWGIKQCYGTDYILCEKATNTNSGEHENFADINQSTEEKSYNSEGPPTACSDFSKICSPIVYSVGCY